MVGRMKDWSPRARGLLMGLIAMIVSCAVLVVLFIYHLIPGWLYLGLGIFLMGFCYIYPQLDGSASMRAVRASWQSLLCMVLLGVSYGVVLLIARLVKEVAGRTH